MYDRFQSFKIFENYAGLFKSLYRAYRAKSLSCLFTPVNSMKYVKVVYYQNESHGNKNYKMSIINFVSCLFVQGWCSCITHLPYESNPYLQSSPQPWSNSTPWRVYYRKGTWIQWRILNRIDLVYNLQEHVLPN